MIPNPNPVAPPELPGPGAYGMNAEMPTSSDPLAGHSKEKKSGYDEDPTQNVRDLLALSMERADRLREAEQGRVNELMSLRSAHAAELRDAEAKRIDAIRAVDVNAVSVANERATAQAAVLANQVALSAETLRALVASTAATQATQLNQTTQQIMDRVALLEKSQYEIRGTGSGKRDVYGWIAAAVGLLISVATIMYTVLKH